jgi:sugar phosphate permease
VYGWIGAGHQAGAAVAAYGAGVLRVQNNNYIGAFMFAGAACVLAALLILTIHTDRPARRAVTLSTATT